MVVVVVVVGIARLWNHIEDTPVRVVVSVSHAFPDAARRMSICGDKH